VREEAYQVFAAVDPAFANFILGNVVAAFCDACADAAEVQFRAFESAEPNVQPMATPGGIVQEPDIPRAES